MDIPRKDATRKRRIRRAAIAAVVVAGVSGLSYGLSKLERAAPIVEKSTLWPGKVERGPMLRQVRGLGTLVPEEFLWIPAVTEGRVLRIYIRPGTSVEPDSVILTLGSPELETQRLEAEYQVKAAEAKYMDLKVQLDSQTLTQQAELARIESEYQQARLKADRDAELHRQNLLADISLRLSAATAEELFKRLQIEKERLKIQKDSNEAQLAVQKAEIDKLRALHRLKQSQVEALKVRAGTAGVLQELLVQEGQQLAAGTMLAKVVQPAKLKAELKIAETQAKDIVIGQPAYIDTRNGIIPGRVSRIDPAAKEGTVTVDVHLEGRLPPGARPDLSVDGVIEIERLADVLYVGRPAFGQPNSTVSIFKIDEDGKTASRVRVKLGRSSVHTIEVVEGLREGDQVILSDMSAWDSVDKIRLN
jgi:HlyD family secretion protein